MAVAVGVRPRGRGAASAELCRGFGDDALAREGEVEQDFRGQFRALRVEVTFGVSLADQPSRLAAQIAYIGRARCRQLRLPR